MDRTKAKCYIVEIMVAVFIWNRNYMYQGAVSASFWQGCRNKPLAWKPKGCRYSPFFGFNEEYLLSLFWQLQVED